MQNILAGMNKQKIVAIVIGVIITGVGIFFGFRAILGRAAGEEPQAVQISEINENSASVSWTSGTEAQCTLEYGTSPTSLNFFAPESQASTTHSVKLTLLSPNTTYYFQIRCGEKSFTNGGVPWSFTTKEPESNTRVSPTSPVTPTTVRPSPIQTITVPTKTPDSTSTTCTDTDCEAIKSKLGKGCTTQDYFKCVRKLTPTDAP